MIRRDQPVWFGDALLLSAAACCIDCRGGGTVRQESRALGKATVNALSSVHPVVKHRLTEEAIWARGGPGGQMEWVNMTPLGACHL